MPALGGRASLVNNRTSDFPCDWVPTQWIWNQPYRVQASARPPLALGACLQRARRLLWPTATSAFRQKLHRPQPRQ
jgi:hypothetical protein